MLDILIENECTSISQCAKSFEIRTTAVEYYYYLIAMECY